MLRNFFLLSLAVLFVRPSIAQPVRVAVAANAQYVAHKLADDFRKKTGITIEVISGASGKLATQIRNGAPYDVFLSADMDFAQALFADGNALMKPRVYALGSLIVCSTTGADISHWTKLINDRLPGKIAIGNPKVAPYGKAAEEALRHYGLYTAAADRLVFAESISQVNSYVMTGAVNIGFTTGSLVYELQPGENFKWQTVDPAAYTPIQQGAVMLRYTKSKNFVKSKKFYDYLFSAAAKAIFRQFGYRTVP